MKEYDRDKVPELVNILESSATHEAEVVGRLSKARRSGLNPNPDIKHCLIVVMGKTTGLPRPNFGKALCYQREWYYILTWTDVFGRPIRECQLQRTHLGNSVIFLEKALPQHNDILELAAEAAELPLRL